MKNSIAKPNASLLPAPLATLALATAPYGVQVDGNSLAPALKHGQIDASANN